MSLPRVTCHTAHTTTQPKIFQNAFSRCFFKMFFQDVFTKPTTRTVVYVTRITTHSLTLTPPHFSRRVCSCQTVSQSSSNYRALKKHGPVKCFSNRWKICCCSINNSFIGVDLLGGDVFPLTYKNSTTRSRILLANNPSTEGQFYKVIFLPGIHFIFYS